MNPTTLRQTLLGLLAPALLAVALLPQAVQAATHTGSGKPATETRMVGEFQSITLEGSMDLVVKQGSTQQLQVTADDNLLPLMITELRGSGDSATLVVRFKKGESYHTRSKMQVNVVMPKLNALTASGSGDMRVDAFNTPALQISLSGSGDARLEGLTTADLGIRISGSADVLGSGSASKIKISISGSGDVRLAQMKADDVSVTIAGSGDATVNAEKSLEVNIAGSGDVTFSGNASLKSRVAGSGSVNKK
jgi:carbon monoxide dehydrogenase subunit G